MELVIHIELRNTSGAMEVINQTFELPDSSEERNLEVPLGTTFENVQNKFSRTGLDLCTDLWLLRTFCY